MKNLLAAFVLTAAGSAAAITYCSPDGDDAAAGTPEAPKCSIQKILGANPSETVVLLPGTYHLSDPSQKVEGENGALHSNGAGVLRSATGNPADVVIDGDGQSECIRIAGRFRLEGLTFTGGANPSDGARACLISVQAENCVVSNCVVRGFSQPSGGRANRIAVNLYAQAKIYDTRFSDISGDAVGVALRAERGSLVSGCTFDGVATTGGDAAACAVKAAQNVVVTNCTFRNGTGARAQLRIVGAADEVCRVVDCTFADHALGAAACYAGPYSEVLRCTFARCTTSGNGGALFARTATVRDCAFTENQAAGYGGACLIAYDDVVKTATVLQGCTFTSNVATNGGAAVMVGYGYTSQDAEGNPVSRTANGLADISGCLFERNHALSYSSGNYTGGALMFHTGSASGGLVANCRFVGNAVAGYGGAVNARFHLDGSDDAKGIVLRNCLFADNRASKQGGALYIIGQQSAKPGVTNVVENCTLAGNTAPENADGHGLYQKFGNFRCVNTLFGPSQTVVTGNNPAGNFYQACAFPSNPTQTGGGDSEIRADCPVGADPKFADADAGDYSLAGGSPCVNKGVWLDWMDDAATDLAGAPRVAPKGGLPDIGCYERFVAGGFQVLIR